MCADLQCVRLWNRTGGSTPNSQLPTSNSQATAPSRCGAVWELGVGNSPEARDVSRASTVLPISPLDDVRTGESHNAVRLGGPAGSRSGWCTRVLRARCLAGDDECVRARHVRP